ncbi:MAG: preprotein translocase subunit SecA, partial [Candidatus Marinamargulisbacteria bacterium]|nr:preprotein translocase subunit SecA [Candidatus Marinamargulisbacteria bacterium]
MVVLKEIKRYFKERQLKPYYGTVKQINALESGMQALSDDALREKTDEFKALIASGKTIDSLLVEAFAVVREAAYRVLGMRHFDVQLMGGIVLHSGSIAEMKTGEGKTLVATLPAYLNALSGQGVYVVTVNDYLAKRDCEWMGAVFEFLGLSVGLIQSDMSPDSRLKAYACDVTYGTNNEYGFDYLRDHLATHREECCQTRRHFAIIDEVDSVLIDEARTPLIISGPINDSTSKYGKVVKACRSLLNETHFTCDLKHKNIVLTEAGNEALEKQLKLDSIFSVESMGYAHMAVQCLRALHLFKKDVDYVVKDGQVIIVDEFTGRLMDGRRYSDGLHQSIEACEKLKIQKESQTLASITFQNYFRMFPKLCGMTGTAITESEEFRSIYGLNVVEIPANRPLKREDRADLVYKTQTGKYAAIVDRVHTLNLEGRPVLVGTISIESSEFLSQKFKEKGIPHTVLNAKHHSREADIVAKAGEENAVTIATNMAGRGTDIKLTDGVVDVGGLAIIGTERHESRRIDNQLRGRAGRQGDPGSSEFYVSMEDDLMKLFGSDRMKNMMDRLGMDDTMVIEHSLVNRSIAKAQQKVEQHYYSSRKQVLQYDDVVTQQRQTIYDIRDAILLHDNTLTYMRKFIDALLEQPAFDQTLLHDVFTKPGNHESVSDAYYQQLKTHFSGHPDAVVSDVVRYIVLRTVDRKWVDQLQAMDALREGIGLRAWGQKDPLIEYKKEAFDLFS